MHFVDYLCSVHVFDKVVAPSTPLQKWPETDSANGHWSGDHSFSQSQIATPVSVCKISPWPFLKGGTERPLRGKYGRITGISRGWLGSQVVSMLELRRRRAWVQIAAATLSGNSLRQTVRTHRASVHQAAKLVAALLRVARVTAGLAESNVSLPPG